MHPFRVCVSYAVCCGWKLLVSHVRMTSRDFVDAFARRMSVQPMSKCSCSWRRRRALSLRASASHAAPIAVSHSPLVVAFAFVKAEAGHPVGAPRGTVTVLPGARPSNAARQSRTSGAQPLVARAPAPLTVPTTQDAAGSITERKRVPLSLQARLVKAPSVVPAGGVPVKSAHV